MMEEDACDWEFVKDRCLSSKNQEPSTREAPNTNTQDPKKSQNPNNPIQLNRRVNKGGAVTTRRPTLKAKSILLGMAVLVVL